MNLRRNGIRTSLGALGATVGILLVAGVAKAQVPANIETELIKMGHIVDPVSYTHLDGLRCRR